MKFDEVKNSDSMISSSITGEYVTSILKNNKLCNFDIKDNIFLINM